MLKISRDFNGNTTSVHLENGAYIPINLTTYAINWDYYTNANTRAAIQVRWNEWSQGKDIAFELRDRPELARPLVVAPNWAQYAAAINQNAAYIATINSILTTPANARVVARYESALDILRFANTEKRIWLNLISRWNAATALVPALSKPTVVQVGAWNSICNNNDIPFTYNTDTLSMVIRAGI